MTRRELAFEVGCWRCGAAPGEPCRGRRGARAACHAERYEFAGERRVRSERATAAERIEMFGEEALGRLAGLTLSDGAKLAYVLVFSHEGDLHNARLARMIGLDEHIAACFAEELEYEELIVRLGYASSTRYSLLEGSRRG